MFNYALIQQQLCQLSGVISGTVFRVRSCEGVIASWRKPKLEI
jgi:hypothetical protein